MKSFCSLLFVICIITIIGCRKDKQAEPEPAKESCRIEAVNPVAGNSSILTYDEENKLKTIVYGNIKYEYTYDGNTVVINRKLNGNLSGYRSSYLLNAAGLPISQTIKYYNISEWSNLAYEYEEGKIKRITTTFSDGRPASYIVFTWNNGNLESRTQFGNTYYYEYYTDQTVDADYFDVEHIRYDPGIKYIFNRNRVKSKSYAGDVENYSYMTDAQGRVKTVKVEAGPNTALFDLHLQCK